MATRRVASATALAKKPTTALTTPDFLAGENTGLGVSNKTEDNIVPLVKLLQKGSPQVNKKEEAYIDGAEAGDIWLKPDVVIKGDEGIVFQPCGSQHAWVEWLPDRAGFVQAHPYNDAAPNQGRPADARLEQDANGKKLWVRDNGNLLVDTRYEAGVIYRDGAMPRAFIIPLAGTGHTFAKTFNTLRGTKLLNGGIANSYTSLYRLKTSWAKNTMGDWYQWTVTDLGWVPDTETLEIGKEFASKLAKGEKRIEQETNDDDKIPF